MSFRITLSPVAILLVSATILSTSSQASAKSSRVSGDFNSLGAAVRMYKMTSGALPDPEIGLNSLTQRPTSLPLERKWVQIIDEVPTDPWGNPYRYVAGDGYPDGFGFYSSGIDEISRTQGNDPDDINSWSQDLREPLIDLKLQWKTAAFLLAGSLAIGFLVGKIVSQGQIRSTNNSS